MPKSEKKPGKYDITFKVNATFDQLIAVTLNNGKAENTLKKSSKKKK